ncbi:Glyoxalase/Bleomycin resistance protein/Dioxygenase superfamily protein [Salinibacillus kushneri]|uniref:Glyoxalase/Bleomycin resistance protein/Dioxygenase superfamily protein n=2 Tax=Salinibacillus kushneri TaxID=237682 RepID=A0A1I0HB11_9BACI|nr:Glyoxalase/Bleomycin resistance protein/Dioxygenase superfamily protein [Salinibacillus kushneri]
MKRILKFSGLEAKKYKPYSLRHTQTSLLAEAEVDIEEIMDRLGHNGNRNAEVDKVMVQAKQAEATITNPTHDTFWGGYSGHFQDPDGHLWEVVWNPNWDTIV